MDPRTTIRRASAALCALLCLIGISEPADGLVMVTDPDDPTTFFNLFRPTGKFDETGLSGFEFLISSRTGEFRANDQYLISGEDTNAASSIANDLGAVGDLSDVQFGFSIQHNLVGGRNFTFSLTNLGTNETHALCWGNGCDPGTPSTQLLAGIPPIRDYNGIQLQVRAQEVVGSSASVTVTSFSGAQLSGAAFFDEVVTPDVPGTIFSFDTGRRGQWYMADSLDLILNEWELAGLVTLSRPDSALSDLTKVRIAIDLVRDPNLPFVPEPAGGLLVSLGLAALGLLARRHAVVSSVR